MKRRRSAVMTLPHTSSIDPLRSMTTGDPSAP